MADETVVYMPKADWAGITNKTREKGGTTDLLLSSEVAAAIDAIPGQELADGIISNVIDGHRLKSNARKIGPFKFWTAYSLHFADFPEALEVQKDAFRYCSNLEGINLPKAETLEDGAFSSSGITSLELPAIKTIGDSVFHKVATLMDLWLPGQTMCNAIGDIELNSTCKIHVPASLLSQYKAATNWAAYAGQFVAI